MPRVSIIVPVYKTEKYIRRCLDSVAGQTLDDIEIILIDDGSPDSCGEICEEYKRKDGRIRVIHQENQGVSAARNAGLRIAAGEYIGFVDSDDYVESDMYEFLYGLAMENNADIAGCEFFDCYDGQGCNIRSGTFCDKLDRIQGIQYVLESKTSVSVDNKIFRRNLFQGLEFREGIIFEDAYIIVDLLAKSDCVIFTDTQKYYYFHREDSITTQPFNEKFYNAVEAHDYCYQVATSISDSLKKNALVKCCWARFFVLDKMYSCSGSYNHEKEKEYINFLRRNRNIIMNNNVLTWERKLAFIGLFFNKRIYKIFLGFNARKKGRNNG